ncbi:MAG: hypothetical protein KJO95_09280 [Gammaproteobacteria bacterium]|nr:hypothetical protein [Gammaproteobacteria bacterium]MBU2677711.1 hypothetical protein [Gammaproteobacteria bacterium]NNL51444.1 hypothetical protein [Woeseiaceae bacterium]
MRNAALILVLLTTSPSFGSPLFEENSILDVTISGPLSTLLKHKQDGEEYPFSLTVDDASIDVAVRVRGNSRVVVCRFPPLRLNFTKAGPDGTAFAGEDKLKLVTHCRNGDDKSQSSVLNEFTAYRIFNLISDQSYRVRLLKIRYEDTDGKQKKLEEPHYGFLIESDEGLERRLGGTVAKVEALRFSSLDILQTARINVFQYLIGNKDWSFVTADSANACCHNIDLLDVDSSLVPIPYDFDLAALTQAKYRGDGQLNQSRRREYFGYCRTPADMLDQAIDYIQPLKDEILTTVLEVPALDDKSRERRAKFISSYFEEALGKTSLLAKFDRDCIGKR